ncbi:MAG: hypothetical protein ACRETX_15010, partial [Steroidobacteraceae bacterium]
MKFILALVGAFGAFWSAEIDNEFFAIIAGAAIGWLFGMFVNLRDRAAALEQKVQQLAANAARAAAQVAAESRPEAAPRVEPPARSLSPETVAKASASDAPAPVGARVPVEPRKPREPDLFERAFAYARDWLLSGNVPVKVGVIISFFGVAFLLKYAVDEGLLSFP